MQVLSEHEAAILMRDDPAYHKRRIQIDSTGMQAFIGQALERRGIDLSGSIWSWLGTPNGPVLTIILRNPSDLT